MVKYMRLAKRASGVPVEPFRTSWQELIETLAATGDAVRCVLSLPPAAVYDHREPPFDAVAELWFQDDASHERFRRQAVTSATLASEGKLVDVERSVWFDVDDAVVKDEPVPPDAVKTIVAVHPRPSLTPAAFHHHWRQVHAPIGAALPHLCRYVQSHARDTVTLGGRSLAGCALTWFPSTDAIRSSMRSAEWQALSDDERNFVDDDCPVVLTRERVVRDDASEPHTVDESLLRR